MKKILTTYGPPRGHWVGDGFPVRSLFSYDRMGASNISPFLLLDYAGPSEFPPAQRPRGVGQHPHRGFETVTVVYSGELEHRDTSGAGGLIGEGDVQWMTAGAGIVHEEFHSQQFTEQGGLLKMVQLWVNLPASAKDTPAAYQTLLNKDIPRVSLEDDGGALRVIAGEYLEHKGPARTFTPINVWDLKLEPGARVNLPVPKGHTTLVAVLNGSVQINDTDVLREAELANLDREGQEIVLESNNDARLLVLSGEPIDEPVVGYGPFVMNTEGEIKQAMLDFQSGKFGAL
ncbi:pirin family protein [Marinobacter salarius]|uniref:pirin family protein n=1 Tax=Marinobacter salarius TaxID=1420917 RepID=UPI0010A995F2|nr:MULTISPECIES: pirin family protein [Marinobacter]MBJ7301997.1 pirin family protein [Marinobacter salarius]HIO29502.1 pirin family protein [Marinobacter salarius]HIO99882.1 pirin family protein [Marinobacter salarius]